MKLKLIMTTILAASLSACGGSGNSSMTAAVVTPTPLNVRLMTHTNDPNAYLASNTAFIIGKVPFKANTVYNVSFSGSAGTTAISKTWSFARRS